MKNVLRGLVVLLIVLLGTQFLRRNPEAITAPREEIWLIMGTVASLRTPATARAAFPEMLQIAENTFADVNATLSVYDPESELSRLNANGLLEPVSDLTRKFLVTTQQMTKRTGGRFDPTLLPVIQLWGFSGGVTPESLPTEAEILQALSRSGLAHLVIEDERVHYPERPSHIDSGGIAKGFALDRAYDAIRQAFPDVAFLLNLGGEIRVQGKAEPGRAWRIGVQHPLRNDATIGVISVPSAQAVSTSGHYERYFVQDGIRYAHIIDPATGWPVTGMAGVTVLCPNATEADVLSTALFVAGMQDAKILLQSFPDSHALLIPDREPLEIYLSDGMQEWFEPAPEFRANIRPFPTR